MLESLPRRPRGRLIAPLLAGLTGGRIAGGASGAGPGEDDGAPASDLLEALRAYGAPWYEDGNEVTQALLDRLEAGDRESILAAADGEWRDYYGSAGASEQRHLLLHYAAHWNVGPVLARTRLPRLMPPEDVHAMARGPLASGGGLWFADLIVAALARVGVPIAAGQRVLDFGCSSGRVIGALGAWRDDVDWIGCDPNAAATAWADANLPGVSAFASPQEPPLPLEDASLDVVYAISVWSHFGEAQAVRWLQEMSRVIRPGGALVITTQGLPSLASYLQRRLVDDDYARETARDLIVRGHRYVVAFGEDGDWGVKHPEWGMAYMTAEWLATRTLPDWSLKLFEPARVDRNQDLAVLIRS